MSATNRHRGRWLNQNPGARQLAAIAKEGFVGQPSGPVETAYFLMQSFKKTLRSEPLSFCSFACFRQATDFAALCSSCWVGLMLCATRSDFDVASDELCALAGSTASPRTITKILADTKRRSMSVSSPEEISTSRRRYRTCSQSAPLTGRVRRPVLRNVRQRSISEHECIVGILNGRQFLCVYHDLERLNPLT